MIVKRVVWFFCVPVFLKQNVPPFTCPLCVCAIVLYPTIHRFSVVRCIRWRGRRGTWKFCPTGNVRWEKMYLMYPLYKKNVMNLQKNPRMGENFDPIFTRGRTELTPPDANSQMILSNLTGYEFKSFSFVNPYFEPCRTEELVIPTT